MKPLRDGTPPREPARRVAAELLGSVPPVPRDDATAARIREAILASDAAQNPHRALGPAGIAALILGACTAAALSWWAARALRGAPTVESAQSIAGPSLPMTATLTPHADDRARDLAPRALSASGQRIPIDPTAAAPPRSVPSPSTPLHGDAPRVRPPTPAKPSSAPSNAEANRTTRSDADADAEEPPSGPRLAAAPPSADGVRTFEPMGDDATGAQAGAGGASSGTAPAPARPSLVETPTTASASDEATRLLRAVHALRSAREPRAALRHLDAYFEKYPRGALHEEALRAGIEAGLAAGDERARAWARAYLILYPKGRFRAEAEGALRE